jgi:hypothetical protein
VASYINFMIALSPGGAGTFAGQSITRSTNTFGSLPTASATGAVDSPGPGITTIDLNALGTFTYLFAKYDGQNDISQVWYIGDLTGILTIPAAGPNGYGLSGWILFRPTGQVPRRRYHSNVARRSFGRSRYGAALPNELTGRAFSPR